MVSSYRQLGDENVMFGMPWHILTVTVQVIQCRKACTGCEGAVKGDS